MFRCPPERRKRFRCVRNEFATFHRYAHPEVSGYRTRFIEHEPTLLEQVKQRSRSSRLLFA
jgi:hypothetical protein